MNGSDEGNEAAQLLRVLLKLAGLQRQHVDAIQLKDCIAQLESPKTLDGLSQVTQALDLVPPRPRKTCDAARLPCLRWSIDGWSLVLGQSPQGRWVVGEYSETGEYAESEVERFSPADRFMVLDFQARFVAHQSHTLRMIVSELFNRPRWVVEMALAGIFMMLLAVAVSLFSIQVYDRVIPAAATSTLYVLGSGVLLALLFELTLRFSRSGVVQRMTDRVDQRLARDLMSRFLGVRLASLPTSVGAATQTLKGYETIRGFLISLLTVVTVDLPVALFLLLVIFWIGGPLGYVALGFAALGGFLAWVFNRQAEALAGLSQAAHSRKTGILVESLEGAETLKANHGRWRILSQWLSVTDQAREVDNRFRHVSENAQFWLMFFQQAAYVLMIAVGSLLVIRGELTLGGLIGCSILTGRVLTPVSQLPNLTVSWAHAKSALKALEQYWNLPQEDPAQAAVFTETLMADIELRGVTARCYGSGSMALTLPDLSIKAGDRIGLVGPVGSGKSSVARLLCGLIQAESGQVQLGGVNIDQLNRATLAQHVGYVSQDARLISGTVRDNLILGLPDPGDDEILRVCDDLGVTQFVLNGLPKGLETPISESGGGLSGGQKQLIHWVRALLKQPSLLILDEPSASLDPQLESKAAQQINTYLHKHPKTTLILVTHKASLLPLVDRLWVLAGGRIAMDGPRDDILKKLSPGAPA